MQSFLYSIRDVFESRSLNNDCTIKDTKCYAMSDNYNGGGNGGGVLLLTNIVVIH